MDVVRTKIEAIGGAVDVDSAVGRGTTWRLRIPLTLAIMPAVTVECDRQTYAIPQVSLLELVALDVEAANGGIEYVRSAPVYRLRGDLLPLVDLREVFGRPARDGSHATIAVLQTDTVRFGLLVDRVLNTEEIVVKPLSGRLKAIGLYAGATLMGDGQVALILDIQGLARRSLTTDSVEQARRSGEDEQGVRDEVEQVLVAGIGDGRRVAIPLSAVTRLERLPAEVLEHVGQPRGRAVPRLDHPGGAARPRAGLDGRHRARRSWSWSTAAATGRSRSWSTRSSTSSTTPRPSTPSWATTGWSVRRCSRTASPSCSTCGPRWPRPTPGSSTTRRPRVLDLVEV